MKNTKTSISKANSYEGIGEFWDNHDLSDVWEETEPVQFEVNIQSSKRYFAVESKLSEKLREIANQQGVSTETLLNLWLQERVGQEQSAA